MEQFIFKRTQRISVLKSLVFAWFVVFSFGQLPAMFLEKYVNFPFNLHPLDLVTGLIFLVGLKNIGKDMLMRLFLIAIVLFGGSMIWFSVLSWNDFAIGFLYLVRIVSYLGLGVVVNRLYGQRLQNKILIYRSLILASFAGLFFGWVQYFWFFDLISLKYFGWDDHLGRMTSVFLDPAFFGLILVFGMILLLARGKKLSKKLIVLLGFFLIGLGLTYSRASFLGLLGGLGYLIVKMPRKLMIIFFLMLFVILLPFLPHKTGEGVNLARTKSIILKVDNTKDGLEMVSRSPVFGLGVNNLCAVRKLVFSNNTFGNHSCGGYDNSFIFILATTGVVGFLIFIYEMRWILAETRADRFGLAFKATIISLFIHANFTNSIVYPWILGYVVLLGAISRKNS